MVPWREVFLCCSWTRNILTLLLRCYDLWACITKFRLQSWVCFFSAVTSAFQLFTCKLCLQFSGLGMRSFTWNRFPIKNLLIDSLLAPIVESTYLNIIQMYDFSRLYTQWRNWRGKERRIAPPGKLHVKVGRPISLYFIFSNLSVSCCLFAFFRSNSGLFMVLKNNRLYP